MLGEREFCEIEFEATYYLRCTVGGIVVDLSARVFEEIISTTIVFGSSV